MIESLNYIKKTLVGMHNDDEEEKFNLSETIRDAWAVTQGSYGYFKFLFGWVFLFGLLHRLTGNSPPLDKY